MFHLIVAEQAAQAANSMRIKPWQTDVMREFENLYRPLARTGGKTFKLHVAKNDSSSAEAHADAKKVEVTVNTGLLENARLTADGLRIILCHEFGHIFGGAPRRNIPMEWDGAVAPDGKSFASSEGQADYYASTSCFHRIVRGQDHLKPLAEAKPTARAERQCSSYFGLDTEDSRICQRTAAGAENMLQLNHTFPISFDTPDKSMASKIVIDSYPERQCRLDTFLAGALCRQDMPLSMNFSNAAANDCRDAVRPTCWYGVPVAARESQHHTQAADTPRRSVLTSTTAR